MSISFSIHCFNNYEENGACIDLELSYFLECSTLSKLGRKGQTAKCVPNCKFNHSSVLKEILFQTQFYILFQANDTIHEEKAVLIMSASRTLLMDFEGKKSSAFRHLKT